MNIKKYNVDLVFCILFLMSLVAAALEVSVVVVVVVVVCEFFCISVLLYCFYRLISGYSDSL
uniref:Uncharacterized protein n=1 Tax=Octopus bimaculoides TaxID=37653 RepID=A0A0L8FQH5_OCTBM